MSVPLSMDPAALEAEEARHRIHNASTPHNSIEETDQMGMRTIRDPYTGKLELTTPDQAALEEELRESQGRRSSGMFSLPFVGNGDSDAKRNAPESSPVVIPPAPERQESSDTSASPKPKRSLSHRIKRALRIGRDAQ